MAVEWGEAGKIPHAQRETGKQSGIVCLHMVAALGASGMEGSTDSRSYMLGLLLIALNFLLFEIASVNTSLFREEDREWRLGGMWLPSLLSTRLFTPDPEHIKAVMVSERWSLVFWS